MENLTHGEGRTPQMPASRPKRARGSAASLFARARRLHDAGHLEKAAREYRAVLAREPRHLDALHLLGVARLEAGDYRQAIELIDQALAEGLRYPEVHNHLGIAYLRVGEPSRALDCFDDALHLRSDYAEARANRGACLIDMGRPAEAAQELDAALARQASLPGAHRLMAAALTRLGDEQGALRALERAADLDPRNAELRCLLADAQKSLDHKREALNSYREALRLDPGYVPAYVNLGNLCAELGHFDIAVRTYSHALRIAPTCASALISRGTTFLRINLVEEARIDFAKAVALEPQNALAQANLAACHAICGDSRQAVASLDRAMALDPGNQRILYNKALFTLGMGDYEEGWPLYEVRHQIHSRGFVGPADRAWRGEQALAGKTLLLHAEQGLGDTIQFCRYATLAAERGARVLLLVPRPLQRLMQTLPGVTQVLGENEALPPYDFHCPLLSLPLAFSTTLDSIPASSHYLRADREASLAWKHRMPANGKRRIGLVWNGGLRMDKPDHWGTNERRNIPLDAFIGILGTEHDFYSLQKGEPAESEFRNRRQHLWPHSNLLDFSSDLHDFADTAALIENLDLVISVDTSTAHLAAALGKPVWLLNRYDTCWRWLHEREDSPWYPGMRIFRQRRIGHWDDVIAEVRAHLGGVA